MAKKNEPKNCAECRFCNEMMRCKKLKIKVGPYDWCAAGRKK